MNQSESFVDVFRPWHDGKSNIDIKFLNYSGNVYYQHGLCIKHRDLFLKQNYEVTVTIFQNTSNERIFGKDKYTFNIN